MVLILGMVSKCIEQGLGIIEMRVWRATTSQKQTWSQRAAFTQQRTDSITIHANAPSSQQSRVPACSSMRLWWRVGHVQLSVALLGQPMKVPMQVELELPSSNHVPRVCPHGVVGAITRNLISRYTLREYKHAVSAQSFTLPTLHYTKCRTPDVYFVV